MQVTTLILINTKLYEGTIYQRYNLGFIDFDTSLLIFEMVGLNEVS